jgi:hypothetical protein
MRIRHPRKRLLLLSARLGPPAAFGASLSYPAGLTFDPSWAPVVAADHDSGSGRGESPRQRLLTRPLASRHKSIDVGWLQLEGKTEQARRIKPWA